MSTQVLIPLTMACFASRCIHEPFVD
eukprot:COSAG02_NODE_67853_length_252_cov_0.633987_1_plen_25_part_10